LSFSICRIEKIKLNGVTGIQIHDRREKEVSHTNKDIDWNKTNENIDLLQKQGKFRAIVKDRIDDLDLPRAIRKDATVMVQTMITSDKTFFDKMNKLEQISFFEKSYDFIKNRYGERNMVSAIIHFDETTPHMHVNFLPVTDDGRLSARDLFSPAKLRQLQDDFNKNVNDNGYDLERGKLDSKRKHLNVEEFKLETKFSDLKLKEKELDKKINDLVDKRDTVKNELNAFKSNLKDIKDIEVQMKDINLIKGKYVPLSKEYVIIKASDLEKLKSAAKQSTLFKNEAESLIEDKKILKEDMSKLYKSRENILSKCKKLEKSVGEHKKEYGYLVDYIKKSDQLDEATNHVKEKRDIEKNIEKINKNVIHKNINFDLEI